MTIKKKILILAILFFSIFHTGEKTKNSKITECLLIYSGFWAICDNYEEMILAMYIPKKAKVFKMEFDFTGEIIYKRLK